MNRDFDSVQRLADYLDKRDTLSRSMVLMSSKIADCEREQNNCPDEYIAHWRDKTLLFLSAYTNLREARNALDQRIADEWQEQDQEEVE